MPVGLDWTYAPWHRVYGAERLPRLLEGWQEVSSRFFAKDADGPWMPASREKALAHPRCKRRYALGQFTLKRST
jgi:hypothetical protein